ncbi:unnamed protein product, partial [marine sediment metagenome]
MQRRNRINKDGVNGFVMNEDTAIVFGMLIGLKNERIKSFFLRMTHHVLSQVMEFSVMQ